MLGKIEISLDQIKSNWTALNFASKGKAAAVVKADAYGFGMTRITKTLINAGCKYFYVANLHEAIQLRKVITNKDIRIAVFEGFLEGNEPGTTTLPAGTSPEVISPVSLLIIFVDLPI